MKITFYSSTNEVLSEIGSRIKAARIAMPATQKELAELTNLSQRTISNIETGKDVSFSSLGAASESGSHDSRTRAAAGRHCSTWETAGTSAKQC